MDDTNAEANPQTACTPTHSCSPSLYDPITNFMDYRCLNCATLLRVVSCTFVSRGR